MTSAPGGAARAQGPRHDPRRGDRRPRRLRPGDRPQQRDLRRAAPLPGRHRARDRQRRARRRRRRAHRPNARPGAPPRPRLTDLLGYSSATPAELWRKFDLLSRMRVTCIFPAGSGGGIRRVLQGPALERGSGRHRAGPSGGPPSSGVGRHRAGPSGPALEPANGRRRARPGPIARFATSPGPAVSSDWATPYASHTHTRWH